MNFREDCENNNINLSEISKIAIKYLASSYLEGANPKPSFVDTLRKIESGELCPKQAYVDALKK